MIANDIGKRRMRLELATGGIVGQLTFVSEDYMDAEHYRQVAKALEEEAARLDLKELWRRKREKDG